MEEMTMALRIDWDNYTVLEAEDYEVWEIDYQIEEVRDEMDRWLDTSGTVPDALEELMIELNDMEEVQNGTDQG
jgi:hypothetical protein